MIVSLLGRYSRSFCASEEDGGPDLRGIFPLTKRGIDESVTEVSPGAFALGHRTAPDAMSVDYVGRGDADVGERLREYVGAYPDFEFDYCATTAAAFEKQCELYHDFQPPDNRVHPDRPKGSGLKCPRCPIFG